jgi:hypothetical protein
VKKKIKSQAAMEYLMTYGWAILIIALALGVLYSLGIMNPKNFLPRAPPGSCFVFRPNGPGTTDFVSLQGTCGYLPMYVASFNGINSYVEIPLSTLNIQLPYTVVAWIYPSNLSGGRGVIQLFTNNGKIRFSLYFGYTDSEAATPNGYDRFLWGGTPGTIKIGNWYNSVWIVNTTNTFWYVNGVLIFSSKKNDPYSSLSSMTTKLQIATGYYERIWNGSIINIQIYNKVLTPQEIQYLYQQGLGGGPVAIQNLVGWWPLNGDAKDYSGNNLHGTIYGGVTFVQNYNPP